MTTRNRCGKALGALALGLSLVVSPAARGQAVDPQRAAAAQALYAKATADMDAKDYASACKKLEEVTRLAPEGLGAKLTLGDCYAALGRLASAWGQYVIVKAAAAQAGQAERAEKASKKAEALEPKLATLAVEVPASVRSIPGITITRDGVSLGEAQWGVALPVDAGAHEVVATAPGYKAWKRPVDVAADGAKVAITVEGLEAEPKVLVGGPAGSGAGAVGAGAERAWQRPVGIAAMGLGGAGIAVGAVLGGLAIAKNGESNEDNHCDAGDLCDATGLALRSEAVGLGHGSTAAIVAGGVFLAAGVALFVMAPSAADQERAAGKGQRWSARVDVGLGHLQVVGAW